MLGDLPSKQNQSQEQTQSFVASNLRPPYLRIWLPGSGLVSCHPSRVVLGSINCGEIVVTIELHPAISFKELTATFSTQDPPLVAAKFVESKCESFTDTCDLGLGDIGEVIQMVSAGDEGLDRGACCRGFSIRVGSREGEPQ